jgi:hypothetical protein
VPNSVVVWSWTETKDKLENYIPEMQPKIEAAFNANLKGIDLNDTYRIDFGTPHYQTNAKYANVLLLLFFLHVSYIHNYSHPFLFHFLIC